MKRPRADYSVLALPKIGVRIRDESVLETARRRERCEVCKRPGSVDAHHVKSRGSGGHDVASNILGICRSCHDLAHRGLISKAELLEIVRNRSDSLD